jgi:transposase
MTKQRRIFTQAFKDQAVKMAKESGLSVCEVARRLNVNEANIRQWMGRKKDSRVERTKESEELIQLRKAHKRALMELEILKKAAAFFANECNKDTHL